MRSSPLRTWFLCTLLLVGLMPMPMPASGSGCCGDDRPEGVGALVDVCDLPTTLVTTPAIASCCAGDVPPCPDAGEGDAEPDGCDCNGCDGTCRCLRCGCSHVGHAPAMRPAPTPSVLGTGATHWRVPARVWIARDATGDLLRPPRA